MSAEHLWEWLREHRAAVEATEAGAETEAEGEMEAKGETSGSEERESTTNEGTSYRGE